MASNKKQNIPYQLLISWVVIGLLFSGLIFDPASREPFLPVRQFLGSIWLAVGAIFIFRIRSLIPVPPATGKLFLVAGIAYVAWNFLSITWSTNPTEALLTGNRALIQVELASIFILLGPALLKRLGILARILAIYLCFLSVLSLMQYAGWTTFPIESNSPPVGLFGNRNLLGSALVLLLPWALYLFLTSSRSWSLLGLVSIGTGVAALLFSQTRSAWVASLFAFLAIQLLLVIRRREFSPTLKSRWKVVNLSIAGIALVLACLLTISGQGTPLRENLANRFVSLVRVPSATDQASNEAERNILDRYHLWQHTLELIENNPLKGVGAGNWKIAFANYGGSSAPRFEEKDKLRVRPHNEYLSIASELGLVGLALFLLLMLTVAYPTFRLVFSARKEQEILSCIILTGIGIGLAVDFMFSFPLERMSHSYLIALNIGLAVGLKNGGATPKTLKSAWVLLFGLGALPAIVLSYHHWQANRHFQQLLGAEVAGRWDKAASLSIETEQMPFTSLDPVGDPVEWHTANALKQIGETDAALKKIEEAIEAHPNSHRVWNTKAAILIQQGAFQSAIPALKHALELAPDYEPALVNLGYALYRTDQFDEAIATLLGLDLQQHTKVLPVIWDAGQRIEQAWLDESKIYQVGLSALKGSPSLPREQWPGQVQQLRNQFESDRRFVTAYFETISHYILLKAWQRKMPPEMVINLERALNELSINLAQSPDFNQLAAKIIRNNHLKTLSALTQLPENGITEPEEFLFPLE